mmetsp:Transcript_20176/g.52028  ORF Transcript_20176/g.52028 Transcript_20176/m.52028 type:complete len:448 (-) Transcript_20176:122-1465(-)
MQLIKKDVLGVDGGAVTVRIEQTDDLWHLFNLVVSGDRVRTATERKIHKELASGGTSSTRVKLNLTIIVESVDFDAEAPRLRLSGRNAEKNEHVQLGAHHTLEIPLQRTVELAKAEWDAVALERLEVATDTTRNADVAVLVAQPGIAHLCLITRSLTLVRAKIVVPIGRKNRRDAGQMDRSTEKFYEALLQAVLRHVDFGVVKSLFVGSPGFLADEFITYMWAQAAKRDDAAPLAAHRAKVVRCKASSGFKHSVREVLADSEVAQQLAGARATTEIAALETFLKALAQTDGDGSGRAVYGYGHVRAACDIGAVADILLTDELFRSTSVSTRRQYTRLVEDARAAGAGVHVFSSMHVSGEQLKKMTGVAATLRFPLPEQVLADAVAEARAHAEAQRETGGTAASRGPSAGPSSMNAPAATAALVHDSDSDDDGNVVPLVMPRAGLLDL